MVRSSTIRRLVCTAIAIAAIGAIAEGQRRRGGGWEYRIEPPGPATNDGRFQFCRVMFRSSRYGDGGGWGVDFPRGDINISIRLSELTKAPVSFDTNKEPNYFVVRLTEPEMFQCPFVMLTEVGSAYFDEDEARGLRA